MGSSCRHGNGGLACERSPDCGHCHRHTAVDRRVVAELTVIVVAPGCDGAIGTQRHAVGGSSCHRNDGLACERSSGSGHSHRHTAAGRRVIAELTIGVVAPGGDGAIRAKRQVVIRTRTDSYDGFACERRPCCGHSHGQIALGGGSIAQLAVITVSPGGNRTIGTQSQGVIITSGDSHHSLSCQRRSSGRHSHGHTAVGGCVVAQLAIDVVAP